MAGLNVLRVSSHQTTPETDGELKYDKKMHTIAQPDVLWEAPPQKNHVNLGIAQKGGGGRNACPNCLWQFFSEYKP